MSTCVSTFTGELEYPWYMHDLTNYLFRRVIECSDKFFSILSRHNYVTPTSYLELILTFKKLLHKQREDIMKQKKRYEIGLEKLEFAASQVFVMKKELTDLKPQLIKTSADTDGLMIKIEKDTVEAEAKKKVCIPLHNFMSGFIACCRL